MSRHRAHLAAATATARQNYPSTPPGGLRPQPAGVGGGVHHAVVAQAIADGAGHHRGRGDRHPGGQRVRGHQRQPPAAGQTLVNPTTDQPLPTVPPTFTDQAA